MTRQRSAAAAKIAGDAPPTRRPDDTRSVSEYALDTGDYTEFYQVTAGYIREENAKVGRTFRTLARTRCRRCDHLTRHHRAWPGPCSFALCACPGPEPA